MIRTKNTGYWSTGIILRHLGTDGVRGESWSGSVDFFDGSDAESREGMLSIRCFVGMRPAESALAAVIDTLIADATRLGVGFEGADGKPCLYYYGDGENEDFPPPDGWRHMLRAQADRIGWDSYSLVGEDAGQ